MATETRTLTAEELSRNLMVLGSFVAWHEDRYMRGGYTAAEAFSALCALFGFQPDDFRAVVRGDELSVVNPPSANDNED